MANPPLDVEMLLSPHVLATDIAAKFVEWNSYRNKWIEEKRELRNYLYATDTRTTSNQKLPWSNSTTTPKLTQIYDNLKANYTAALFPSTKWMRWEAGDAEGATKEKRRVIQAYMDNKIRQSKFETEADKLVDDFIIFGNCFATVDYVEEYTELESGETVANYIGPKIYRISPYDIVFNPTASEFKLTPKIIRSIISVGELKGQVDAEIYEKVLSNRGSVGKHTQFEKSDAYVADGFNSIEAYYSSGYVEILTFYGDIYDINSGELKQKRKITVVDRAYIVKDEKISSWLGTDPIFHAGWRTRPDNLYAMGPLDNLVGLQYRIDHLENLKADVFDQIALPFLKIRGDVEDFTYQPGARIIMGEEGDVAPLVPDTTALNADLQIQVIENKMEELAGAPKQAMGIRTPGEKTAFEVQTLENAAGRIFQHKAAKFEREFVEPVLNAMLEAARRNMKIEDTIQVMEDITGVNFFQSITKEDITAKGLIIPIGARHFAERAKRVQNITQLLQLKADPSIGVHLSGKKIAELIAFELGEEGLYGDNIALQEQQQTQELMQDLEADSMENLQIKAEEGL